MALPAVLPPDPLRDAEFERAFELLSRSVDIKQADELYPSRGNAVYTTSVVLWMLIYQRMSPDSTLEAAVKRLLESQPELLLASNKRVAEKMLSDNTGGYSKARSRMPLEAARWLCQYLSGSLIDVSPSLLMNRRVYVLDGTTIALAPENELREAFPPASNQFGTSVWPIAHLVVAHELSSGAALVPEIGAKYGPQAVSETALIEKSLSAMPENSLVMADSNYGIFSVAHQISKSGHTFLLRLTTSRFKALVRGATLIDSGSRHKTWSCRWSPSVTDRKTNPELTAEDALEIRIHQIKISEQLTLNLLTDELQSAEFLAELYEARVHVEIDIRNLKIVLDTENLRARSVDMFYKELYASVISYNLVIQFRRQAAQLINQPPRRLSFKRTWTTYTTFLLNSIHTEKWQDKYRTALRHAMQDKLPNRPGRSYEREVYPKRPKSNQFKKRKVNSKPEDGEI